MWLSRAGLLTWVVAVGVLARGLPDVPGRVDGLASPSFPTALTSVVELALLAVSGWAFVLLGTCMLGGTLARAAAHLVPRVLRGVLLAGVVTGFTAGVAHAGSDAAPDRGTLARAVDGLALPDRPESRTSDAARPPRAEEPEVVLVAPGDTVWAIAAASLEPTAGDEEVAEAARRWYTANRDVIGPDPDLIRPGQRLVAPEGAA